MKERELDLRALMADPDLGGGEFHYVRLRESISDKGRAEYTEEPHQAWGCIQPAPGRERELLPEGDREKDAIVIHTAAPLTAGGKGEKADRVHHDGAVYRVCLVDNRQRPFGFTKATAVLETWETP